MSSRHVVAWSRAIKLGTNPWNLSLHFDKVMDFDTNPMWTQNAELVYTAKQ